MLCARAACACLGSSALCRMVGTRGKHSLSDGTGVSPDARGGRLAIEQSADSCFGSVARFDAYFLFGGNGAFTGEKHRVNRIFGVSAPRGRLEEIFNYYAV